LIALREFQKERTKGETTKKYKRRKQLVGFHYCAFFPRFPFDLPFPSTHKKRYALYFCFSFPFIVDGLTRHRFLLGLESTLVEHTHTPHSKKKQHQQ
jgi:hypothetical protein